MDLTLSYGLAVSISEICASTCISDHLPVLVSLTLPCPAATPSAPVSHRRAIGPLTATQFRTAFYELSPFKFPLNDERDLSVDEILNAFNCTCTEILDCIAPLRPFHPKACPQPWLNDYTHSPTCL